MFSVVRANVAIWFSPFSRDSLTCSELQHPAPQQKLGQQKAEHSARDHDVTHMQGSILAKAGQDDVGGEDF